MTTARFVLTRSSGRSAAATPPAPAQPAAPRPAPAAAGCGHHGERKPEPPIFPDVWVNGVEIEAAAIARELQHHPAGDPKEAWTGAARALVVRELLLHEARRRNIAPEPEDEGETRESEEEALVRLLLEEALDPAEPGEAECRRLYESQRDRFRTPDLFEAAHILIEPETDDAEGWAAAEARIRALRADIGDSRSAFVAAARAHSTCPSAQQDGSLGQVRRGELAPPVQKALEDTPPGTNRDEPVRSRFGWHLIRLERRIEGRDLPYEVVEDKIRDTLEARAWAVAAGQYVAELAAAARIEGVELAVAEESPCASC
ncbi:MAG: peptidylprolyl isomerase [Brevundimonas sp.]|uniref:Parvulin-like PPIase n=1 Tax=Brevundimonas albigilva TaxID=1312364 RepID=A0ABY4SJZ0_9CAUL|nr:MULTISPECIES: peptidylprolyl isomerase [Brevundimonas]MCV0416551.1 peptidylprolyl isomerase [Brevundimonas sp.]URI15017.1 peptidylprolyl isomerase [Brevundimonas albigilva]